MDATEGRLVEALREAVGALYKCRYSELPLAKKLDQLLVDVTGKSNADVQSEAVMADPKKRAIMAVWAQQWYGVGEE